MSEVLSEYTAAYDDPPDGAKQISPKRSCHRVGLCHQRNNLVANNQRTVSTGHNWILAAEADWKNSTETCTPSSHESSQ